MSRFLDALMTPQLAEGIASLVGTGLTVLIGFAIRHIAAMTWIAKDAKRVALTNRLGGIAETAARQVQQTYTDAIKSAPTNPDGKLTLEQQQIALGKALAIAKSNLGVAGMAEVEKVLTPDNVAELITSHVLAAKHKMDEASPRSLGAVVGALSESSIGAIDVAPVAVPVAVASPPPVVAPPGT